MENYDLDFKYYAKYTITWFDFRNEHPSFMEDHVSTEKTGWPSQWCTEFIKVFNGIWNRHEINAETTTDFEIMFDSILAEWASYYNELLSGYFTKVDMLEGGKKTGNNKYYNLPNKQINEGKGNLSQVNEFTSTGYDNSLDQKAKYINLIRDVYRELAYRFTDLFIHIF